MWRREPLEIMLHTHKRVASNRGGGIQVTLVIKVGEYRKETADAGP